jgi:hypothetical protein
MLDVTLSILAMIAGGVTMELFAPAVRLAGNTCKESSLVVSEDLQTGNPS